MKRLIIWDFDGVISDTEPLWVGAWADFLQHCYHLNYPYAFWYEMFAGVSNKTKFERLKDRFNITLDVQELIDYCGDSLHEKRTHITLTPNILPLFETYDGCQCIATGDSVKNTLEKVAILHIERFFNKENIFSAEMIEHGKPAPDLFLYAAKQMGYDPSQCVVVDDAVAGVQAAINARMAIIPFAEHHGVLKEHLMDEIHKLGVNKIADNMLDVKRLLKQNA